MNYVIFVYILRYILQPKKPSLSERNNVTFRAYQLGPFLTEAGRAALKHENVFNSININKINFVSGRQGLGFSCLSQFQLGTSPPTGQPQGKFFLSELIPATRGNFFVQFPTPGQKMMVELPGGEAKFFQTRRNCSVLSLQKSLKN